LALSAPVFADLLSGFSQTNIVSNGAEPAAVLDPDLLNLWGISLRLLQNRRCGSPTTAQGRLGFITALN